MSDQIVNPNFNASSIRKIMEASVHENAMLVSLNVKAWSRTKQDKEAVDTLRQHYHASGELGRFSKELASKSSLKRITNAISALRTYHRMFTLPWPIRGFSLLPNARYFEYTQNMNELILEFNAAADALVNEFPKIIEQARAQNGDLFNESEYPTTEELRALYLAEVKTQPLPSPESVQTSNNISHVDRVRIQEELKQTIFENVRGAIESLYMRLLDTVEYAHKRLSDPEQIFRDSLITNIRDIAESVRNLNFVDDHQLNEFCDTAIARLASYEPDALRKDQATRKEAADEAQRLADNMAGYMGVEIDLGQYESEGASTSSNTI